MFNRREDSFREKLATIIRSTIADRQFNGVRIAEVDVAFPLPLNREADIVCYSADRTPYVLIETKRLFKDSTHRETYSPFDKAIIGQVLSYCYLYWNYYGKKIPFFITANPKRYAVFVTPENLEEYVNSSEITRRNYEKVIKNNYLTKILQSLVDTDDLRLNESCIINIFEKIGEATKENFVFKPRLSYAVISLLNDFVDELSLFIAPLLKTKLEDKEYFSEEEKNKLNEFSELDVTRMARFFAYVLMNKIIFYKVLELNYELPRLNAIKDTKVKETLDNYFSYVRGKTGDFDPIFKTDIFDKIPLPVDKGTRYLINNFILTMDGLDISNMGDLVGYVFEEIIPPSERHKLGQFYTPGPIAELICNWAIKNEEDIVLDPGAGSGTFISAAYRRLLKLKIGDSNKIVSDDVHISILSQLAAIDVNPFSLQLCAMGLAIKNVHASSNNVNAILQNYFDVRGDTKSFSGLNMNLEGISSNDISEFNRFNVIVGNPPYTRWDEIPEIPKKRIRIALRSTLEKYGIKLATIPTRSSQLPGIYIFWIIHSAQLLRENGRAGFIISNMWLKSSYGEKFERYLLDNFKVVALIDFPKRVFQVPLMSTLVLLLEKEKEQNLRQKNKVKFIRVQNENQVNISDILNVIEEPKNTVNLKIREVEQKELEANLKWSQFFDEYTVDINWNTDKFVKLSTFYEVSKGNTKWHIERSSGTGADSFFFISKETADEYSIPDRFLYPAISSSRDVSGFEFSESDWKEIRNKGKRCLLFHCSLGKDSIEPEALNYIKWGETECKVSEKRGGGKVCSKTAACSGRSSLIKQYAGWYDLGYIKIPNFISVYQAWRKTRFILIKFNVAIYHGLLAFYEKEGNKLDQLETKALLAYLNSSFAQYYIETHGRKTGAGAIALEVQTALNMPVLDVKNIDKESKAVLSDLFDELVAKAQKVGGAKDEEQMVEVTKSIYRIDEALSKLINYSKDSLLFLQNKVDEMVSRRMKDAKAPDQDFIKGEQVTTIRRPERKRFRKKDATWNVKKLSEFGDNKIGNEKL